MLKLYAVTAAVLLNTLIVIAVVNLAAAAYLAYSVTGPRHYPKAWLVDHYGFDVLKRAYPGWRDDDLKVFLSETSNWLFEYESFTQFRQIPRSDRFITISDAGFRVSPNQGPWPLNRTATNIFVFGGSTTMGAGVPDGSTIPAQLEEQIHRVCNEAAHVYNFGRGFYYSTQERHLFEKLIMSGVVPDLAIFIDGVNDFYYPTNTPQFTDRLSEFMDGFNQQTLRSAGKHGGFPNAFVNMLEALPAYRLWLVANPTLIDDANAAVFEAPASFDDEAKAVIDRWRTNQRMTRAVAEAFGIPLLFVWQPAPTYEYDLDYMNLKIAGKLEFGSHARSGAGYRIAANDHKNGKFGDDFLWLGDMQRGVKRNLYVDAVHYDERFSGEIGEAIFTRLREQNLVPCDREPSLQRIAP
jgi:hypothetical protein